MVDWKEMADGIFSGYSRLAATPGAVPPGERERMSTVKFDELLAECEVERKE